MIILPWHDPWPTTGVFVAYLFKRWLITLENERSVNKVCQQKAQYLGNEWAHSDRCLQIYILQSQLPAELSFIWLIILLSNLHSWDSCNLHESRLALADHLGFVRKSMRQPDYVCCGVGLNSLTNGPGYWRRWWAQVVTKMQFTSFEISEVNNELTVMTSLA